VVAFMVFGWGYRRGFRDKLELGICAFLASLLSLTLFFVLCDWIDRLHGTLCIYPFGCFDYPCSKLEDSNWIVKSCPLRIIGGEVFVIDGDITIANRILTALSNEGLVGETRIFLLFVVHGEIGVWEGVKCRFPLWGRVGKGGEACEC